MAVELNWSRKRQNQEFKDGLYFLESMGLSKSRIGKLTMEDVRKGRHKQHLEIDDDLLSRTVFTVEELDTLKRKFQEMDDDKDGVISEKDLSATMAKLGFGDVPKVRFSLSSLSFAPGLMRGRSRIRFSAFCSRSTTTSTRRFSSRSTSLPSLPPLCTC